MRSETHLSAENEPSEEETTCFITGFSAEETQQELTQFLRQYTTNIVRLSLPDKHPRSRYAFVTFDTKENMTEFMSLGVIKKDNRQLIIKTYTSRNKKVQKNTRLFVHNLPDLWEDADLRELFE